MDDPTASHKIWYALAALFVVCIVTFVVSIVRTGIAVGNSERQFCGLLITLDGAYQTQHPTTPLGRTIAAQIHAVREAYHC